MNIGKILAHSRSPCMKTSLLLVTALATLGAATAAHAARPGETFFGVWNWHSTYLGGVARRFDGPWDACNQYLTELNAATSGHRTLVNITPASDFDNSDDYTCTWTDPNISNGQPQTTTGTAAEFVCPPNANWILANGMTSGGARDKRCQCNPSPNTMSCFSPTPPAYDTSSRCVQPPPLQPTNLSVTVTLPPAQQLLELAVLRQKYDATRIARFPNAGECDFFPDDLWPGPGDPVVNIGKLCGFRDGDFFAADQAAGLPNETHFDDAGERYVWHHNLMNMGEMVLVKASSHTANCPHVGSAGVWAKMFGEMGTSSAPKQILQYRNVLPPL